MCQAERLSFRLDRSWVSLHLDQVMSDVVDYWVTLSGV